MCVIIQVFIIFSGPELITLIPNIKVEYELTLFCFVFWCVGDDFDLIQQEIAMMQHCQHANIVNFVGSFLR